jgi:hypothetical protein
VESVVAHPDYLAYFNQIARGREERFLADSNLDWGQDWARLGRWARQRKIEAIQARSLGRNEAVKLGVPLKPLTFERGWIAVRLNELLGIGDPLEGVERLRGRQPDVRIGKSILLYYWER